MVDIISYWKIYPPQWTWIEPINDALQKLGESMPKQHKKKRTKWKNRKKK